MDAAPVIVFDTDCLLCSGMVAFVLNHEIDEQLQFVGAWSDEGRALAKRYGFTELDLNETFLVIVGDDSLTRSDAGLEVVSHLSAPWSWLGMLRFIPRSVRDWMYGIVAKHRYRWFGMRENCVVVPAEARHRFSGAERSMPN